jgi:hypothetical protein
LRNRILISLLSGALACTPKLQGVCSSDSDCQAGETCGAGGICLRQTTADQGDAGPGDAGPVDAGNPDGGDGGVLTGPINVTAPAPGTFVSTNFRVTAQLAANITAGSVIFNVTSAGSATPIGQLIVDSGANNIYSGVFTVPDPGFVGGALIRASYTQDGSQILSPPVQVTIDQTAPSIATSFNGQDAGWFARSATIPVTATITDDRSGVASAQLILADGGTTDGTVPATGDLVTFDVAGAGVVAAGTEGVVSFSFAATDRAGNRGGLTNASVLKVDGHAPTVVPGAVDGAKWFNGAFSLSAAVDDGAGSGVASVGLQVGTAIAAGAHGAGTAWSFSTDFSSSEPGFEGSLVLHVLATDVVGNVGDAGVAVLVDTVAPSITTSITTAADFVDGTGKAWFLPDAGNDTLKIFADVDGGTGSPIDAASVTVTNATLDGTGAPFTFNASRSALGGGIEGAKTVTIGAKDTAGNQGNGEQQIFFDGVAPTLGANLLTPPSWVARSVNGSPNLFTLSVNAHDSGSGVASVVASNATAGVVANLTAAGDTWSAPVDATFVPAGTEASVPVKIVATDHVGNPVTKTYGVQIDDVAPSLAFNSADTNDTAWHGAQAGNLTFSPTLTISDSGSGVATGANAPKLGGTAATLLSGTTWVVSNFALPTTAIENAAFPVTATAQDVVGNKTTKTLTFQVDNVPPQVTAATLITPFDGTDASNQGWFAGPTAAPGAAAIQVSANISDTFLVTTGAGAPAAVIGSTRVAGTKGSGTTWTFNLPRSIGLNATGPVTVSFDAQDQAGNHPATPPGLSLQFDDVPPAAFKPVIATDANWYSPTAVTTLPVAVTLGTAPRSGITSIVLKVAAKSDVVCTGATKSWSCALPSSDVSPTAETPLAISVVVSNVTNLSSTGTGTRNFDGAPPTFFAAGPVPYPAAATGAPLSWSHDGSHFNLRDSGTLYTFGAFDCGAGISGVQSLSTVPSLAGLTFTISDSGDAETCANGVVAKIFDVAVQGSLSAAAAGAFAGADNILSIALTVRDGAVDATGAPAPHTASSTSPNINVTRRLWQTAANATTSVAMGPVVIASGSTFVGGLNPATGASAWLNNITGKIASGPSVGGTAASPLVYYGVIATSSNQAVSVLASTGAATETCGISPTVNTSGCGFKQITTSKSVLGIASDGSAAFAGTTIVNGFTTNTFDVNCLRESSSLTQVTAAACNTVGTLGSAVATKLSSGRNSQMFVGLDTQDPTTNGSDTVSMAEINLAGGALTGGPSNCTLSLVSDNGGNDAPFCSASRYTWTGSAFALSYNAAAAPTLTLPNNNLFFSGTNAFFLSNGSAAFSGGSQVVALDNAQATGSTIAYLASGSTLSTATVNGSSSFGAGPYSLPALPGTFTDLVMDKSGNLYVVANGQVSAIATDSRGLAGGTAWPLAQRDACKSNSLGFSCPF